jgi:GNAT superfamily N-acetyltransferase
VDSGDAFDRAWAFERSVQDAAAPVRREFEYGVALYDDELRRVYDANFVRFERGFESLTAAVVAELADELQASLSHRKVVIPDDAAAARVTGGLRARGWRLATLVTMAYGGGRVPESGAEQVDPRGLRDARRRALEDGERDPDAVRQIVAFTERVARAVPTRLFAARPAGVGEIGAFCSLFQADGIGQVDEVTTVLRHRRQGLGTAVVRAAVWASVLAGDSLCFLVADEADWPKEWYARLGFAEIGRRFELLRT